jgi:hypothetical protein
MLIGHVLGRTRCTAEHGAYRRHDLLFTQFGGKARPPHQRQRLFVDIGQRGAAVMVRQGIDEAGAKALHAPSLGSAR